jgi:formiminoglutamase
MVGRSSSGLDWFAEFVPAHPDVPEPRPDDPRLAEVAEFWNGDPGSLVPGRPVLIGFPQEGASRPGCADAPRAIRHWLYRLATWDSESGVDLTAMPPLDVGDLRPRGNRQEAQDILGQAIGSLLRSGVVPVVLGGGAETTFAHYLGYVAAGRSVGALSVSADLEVGPAHEERGIPAGAFRRALEHPARPLLGGQWTCLGAQPHQVSRDHWYYAREKGASVRWYAEVRHSLAEYFTAERDRLSHGSSSLFVTLSASAVREADVPGNSVPSPVGFHGEDVLQCARLAGRSREVASLGLVDVNPRSDRDGQSARWAALLVWNFLIGVAQRRPQERG